MTAPLPAVPPRWLPFEWMVALRFLRDGSTQSLFIVFGVAIGVAVIVFMSALLSGMQANFVNRALTGQPHVQLLPLRDAVRPLRQGERAAAGGAIVQAAAQRARGIDQWQALAAQLRSRADVAVVSPVVHGSVLAVRGEASRALSLSGIEPESYTRVVPLQEKIVRGDLRLDAGDILIGTELALDLGIGVGDRLRVAAANGNTADLAVTGIFDMGNKQANLRSAFVALRTAQGLMAFTGQVSAIDLTVRDVYAAEAIAVSAGTAHGVQADSWIRTNEEFFTAVRAQTAANTSIRFFVGLSVAFGIASVLVVSVVQRSREIGILRAMGISRMQVLRLFLLQGGLLALAGSIAGLLLGGGALLVWHALQRNADGTPLFPLVVEPLMFASTLLLATVTGLLAALAPSLRAARLDPVVAIRG